jgi:hypothetical protein
MDPLGQQAWFATSGFYREAGLQYRGSLNATPVRSAEAAHQRCVPLTNEPNTFSSVRRGPIRDADAAALGVASRLRKRIRKTQDLAGTAQCPATLNRRAG